MRQIAVKIYWNTVKMTNTRGWVWAKTDTKMKRSKPNVTWNEARTIRSSQWNSWDMFLICSISYCFIHPALSYSLLLSSNCPFPWFIVFLNPHFPRVYCNPNPALSHSILLSHGQMKKHGFLFLIAAPHPSTSLVFIIPHFPFFFVVKFRRLFYLFITFILVCGFRYLQTYLWTSFSSL